MTKEKIGRTSLICMGTVSVLLGMIARKSIQATDNTSTYVVANNVSICYDMEKSTEHVETNTNVTLAEVTTTTTTTTTTKMETATCETEALMTTTKTTEVTTEVSTTTEAIATLADYAIVTTTVTECEFVDAMEQIDFIPQVNETDVNSTFVDDSDDATTENVVVETAPFEWDGEVITKSGGIVPADKTPSGLKETWYNLYMFGCLDAMNLSHELYDERSDGVKTYNGYVLVASPNLDKWPKGTYIETTRGLGYVVDYCPTGSLDIAVNW